MISRRASNSEGARAFRRAAASVLAPDCVAPGLRFARREVGCGRTLTLARRVASRNGFLDRYAYAYQSPRVTRKASDHADTNATRSSPSANFLLRGVLGVLKVGRDQHSPSPRSPPPH